jgi:two-component system chemotaxis response regulator CheB
MTADMLPLHVDAIVIGTSAGGVDALAALLPALPADFGGAVFVVLHLPRDRPSLVVDIFVPQCPLVVREAEDKEPVAAGAIYFAPPDYHLLIDDGPALALSADEPVHFSRPSIDVLFESAAEIYGARLLGIILTGGSADGASGLAAVRRNGGFTVVQDPSSAQVPLMAEAAIARGPVDRILPLGAIADLLRTVSTGGGGAAGEQT